MPDNKNVVSGEAQPPTGPVANDPSLPVSSPALNLDKIGTAIDAGQVNPPDVHALLDEINHLGLAADSQAIDRANRGYMNPNDVRSLFATVEQAYFVQYGRPTTALRVAADRDAQAQAIAVANASRQAAAAVKASLDASAQDARAALVSKVAQANADAVSQVAAAQIDLQNQLTAQEILSAKKKIKDSLVAQLS